MLGRVDRFHYLDVFTIQWYIAEARFLEKKGIIKWISGATRDDPDTWYENTTYVIKNKKAYDKFTKLIKNIYENLNDPAWNYGDVKANWQYLLIIEKKLKRFRGRHYT